MARSHKGLNNQPELFDALARQRITHFAMNDVALSRVALFRPSGTGARGRAPINDAYKTGTTIAVTDMLEIDDPELGKVSVRFLAGHQLSSREEDLLLVLMAFAGMAGSSAAPAGVTGGHVRRGHHLHEVSVKMLKGELRTLEGPVFVVQIPRRTLAAEWRGRSQIGGVDYAELVDALTRLASIRYDVSLLTGNGRMDYGGCGLMTFDIQEGGTSEQDVRVTFSERIARVILGLDVPAKIAMRSKKRNGKNDGRAVIELPRSRFFTSINLDERFMLSGQVSRLVHRYLSSIVANPGDGKNSRTVKSAPIPVSRIIRGIWGPTPPAPRLDLAVHQRNPSLAEATLADETRVWESRPILQRRDVLDACEAINKALAPFWSISRTEDRAGSAAIIITRKPRPAPGVNTHPLRGALGRPSDQPPQTSHNLSINVRERSS